MERFKFIRWKLWRTCETGVFISIIGIKLYNKCPFCLSLFFSFIFISPEIQSLNQTVVFVFEMYKLTEEIFKLMPRRVAVFCIKCCSDKSQNTSSVQIYLLHVLNYIFLQTSHCVASILVKNWLWWIRYECWKCKWIFLSEITLLKDVLAILSLRFKCSKFKE